MENQWVDIRETLFSLAEEDYRVFTAKLLPGVEGVIGVRLPALRKLAKTIAKSDARTYLKQSNADYFEEIMLQGMVIGAYQAPYIEKLSLTREFVPKINSWSVCDSFCAGIKEAGKPENRELTWSFVSGYFRSEREYELRFAVIMLMDYFIIPEYIARVLAFYNSVRHPGYYVKMAVAWALSVCYVKMPERTALFLKDNDLDDFTYNKSIQKMLESYRIPDEDKAVLRSMKRTAPADRRSCRHG